MSSNDINNINIWKEKDESGATESEFRATPIEDLDLTNRPINGLKRAGCRTVGDLMNLIDSERGLKSVRNLGMKSEAEILEKFQAFKDSFKLKEPSESIANSFSMSKGPSRGHTGGVLLRPHGPIWYTKIEEFNLPKKSIDKLHDCGVYYIADLYTKEFESEPGWTMVRELFAAVVAKTALNT